MEAQNEGVGVPYPPNREREEGRDPSPEPCEAERRLAVETRDHVSSIVEATAHRLEDFYDDDARRLRGYTMRYLDNFEHAVLNMVDQRIKTSETAIERRVSARVKQTLSSRTSLTNQPSLGAQPHLGAQPSLGIQPSLGVQPSLADQHIPGDQPGLAAQTGLGNEPGHASTTGRADGTRLEDLCDRHYRTLRSRLDGILRLEMQEEKKSIRERLQKQQEFIFDVIYSQAKSPRERHVDAESSRASRTVEEGSSSGQNV
ncbi:hypothetical protein PGT21_036121 [Puccinia graminis f. sp. tritici]|uniref:Uncharacterized protein n=1 Tax=Puccinia graminis f. sp. tritici TaxID=56615 RepID=A0A5B0PH55_PUCGR|nr:hypothetical protein PGT21_036121 [Puccinia graminis f. sp. tritici]KAA1100353.1 hypothetical protein PGTUg99_021723 [Puccinia graminis f. sp. tritici]